MLTNSHAPSKYYPYLEKYSGNLSGLKMQVKVRTLISLYFTTSSLSYLGSASYIAYIYPDMRTNWKDLYKLYYIL